MNSECRDGGNPRKLCSNKKCSICYYNSAESLSDNLTSRNMKWNDSNKPMRNVFKYGR